MYSFTHYLIPFAASRPSPLEKSPMLIEARVTSIWKKQKLLIILVFLGCAGYFFFDGAKGYPGKNARYAEWKRFHDADKESEWPAFAAQKGWVADEWTKFVKAHEMKEPYPPHAYSPEQIQGQFLCGALCAVAGAIMLAYFFTQKGRVLRLDDEAFTTSTGIRVPLGAITGLGLKKWESKGYATVLYGIEGRYGSYVIDDYKFDTKPTREICDRIKEQVLARLPAETISDNAASLNPDLSKTSGDGSA
jgi:hypothetical protein